MNQRIKDAISNNIVKPLVEEKSHNLSGTVVRTYYDEPETEVEKINYNSVDVEIVLPSTGYKQVLSRVPIMISGIMGGVEGSRIKVGDTVSISFQGGSGQYPRIIGMILKNPADRNKELRSEAGNNIPEFSSII